MLHNIKRAIHWLLSLQVLTAHALIPSTGSGCVIPGESNVIFTKIIVTMGSKALKSEGLWSFYDDVDSDPRMLEHETFYRPRCKNKGNQMRHDLPFVYCWNGQFIAADRKLKMDYFTIHTQLQQLTDNWRSVQRQLGMHFLSYRQLPQCTGQCQPPTYPWRIFTNTVTNETLASGAAMKPGQPYGMNCENGYFSTGPRTLTVSCNNYGDYTIRDKNDSIMGTSDQVNALLPDCLDRCEPPPIPRLYYIDKQSRVGLLPGTSMQADTQYELDCPEDFTCDFTELSITCDTNGLFQLAGASNTLNAATLTKLLPRCLYLPCTVPQYSSVRFVKQIAEGEKYTIPHIHYSHHDQSTSYVSDILGLGLVGPGQRLESGYYYFVSCENPEDRLFSQSRNIYCSERTFYAFDKQQTMSIKMDAHHWPECTGKCGTPLVSVLFYMDMRNKNMSYAGVQLNVLAPYSILCPEGYTAQPNVIIHCLRTGQYRVFTENGNMHTIGADELKLNLPRCLKNCDLPTLANMIFTINDQKLIAGKAMPVGIEFTAECVLGYSQEEQGTTYVQCLGDNTFSVNSHIVVEIVSKDELNNYLPICKENCDQPTIDNMIFTINDQKLIAGEAMPVGIWFTAVCVLGYSQKEQGTTYFRCVGDNTFSVTSPIFVGDVSKDELNKYLPICKANCFIPATHNEMLTYTIFHDESLFQCEVVTLMCPQGKAAHGSAYAWCYDGKLYSPPDARCEGYSAEENDGHCTFELKENITAVYAPESVFAILYHKSKKDSDTESKINLYMTENVFYRCVRGQLDIIDKQECPVEYHQPLEDGPI